MTNITINNVDEQVKRNFERFCVNVGMNTTTAFSALVNIGLSINEQGLIPNSADDVHRRQTNAVQKFLSDIAALKDEDNILTDSDWEEMANLRERTNAGLARTVEI
jgi:hypothetical protein